MRSNRGYLIFKSLIVTGVACLLSLLIVGEFPSLADMTPGRKTADFQSMDFYQCVKLRRGQSNDSNILVVKIDSCSTEEIAELIGSIDSCHPSAIGLDVSFRFQSPGGNLVAEAINACEAPIILPCEVYQERQRIIYPYFIEEINNPTLGVVNLGGADKFSVIRDAKLSFSVGNDTIPNFACALMSAANIPVDITPEESFLIDYFSYKFMDLEPKEVASNKQLIEGNIVLIGSVNCLSDTQPTPIDSQMPGVMIHAYTLSTLMHGQNLKRVPQWISIILALILCSCLIFFTLRFKGNQLGFVIRLIQVILIFALAYFGSVLFDQTGRCLEVTTSILIIGFGFFALDIWNGVEWVFNKVFLKRK